MKTLQYFLPVLGTVLLLSGCRHTRAPQRPQAIAQKPPTTSVSATAGTPQPRFQIAGKVVDSEGHPVAGAIVESYVFARGGPRVPAELEMKQRVTTGTNGTFELSVTRAATTLLASKPGLAPAWRQFPNVTANKTDERLVLTPSSVLAGVVVDETDKPVPNAEVSVALAYSENELEGGVRTGSYLSGKPARDCFTTHTATNGQFRIEGFPTNAMADLAVNTPGKVLRGVHRDYVGPDTMQWRAGQQDIKLTVEPAGSIEGKIVALESNEPLGKTRLFLETVQPGFFGRLEPVQADTNGAFRFSNVAAGSYRVSATFGTNAVPDLVAEPVPVSVEAGETVRDVRVEAIKGGVLEVAAVAKVDHKRLEQVGVNVSSQNYQNGTSSGSNGLATLRLPPGEYQVSAYKENLQPATTAATVEPGQTNRVEIELSPRPKITGVVRDPSGTPVSNLVVSVFPRLNRNADEIKTDANGRYETVWDPQRFGSPNNQFCLMARDVARNLAASQDIDEDTTTVDLRLERGLVVVGHVEDSDGKPLTNAAVQVHLWSGNMGSSFSETPFKGDPQGQFEITALPPDRRYMLWVTAKGYGSGNQEVRGSDLETNYVELPPFVLNVADRQLAGRVLDADDKPVVGAWVHVSGQGQPNDSVRSDQNGRFTFNAVCEGQLNIYANAQRSYGNSRAEAGDTNVVLRLGVNESNVRETPRRAALKGKPLPDLAAVNLASDAAPAGTPVLLCLFDMEQRPSRRVIRLLNEQYNALRQKGLVVLGIQAAVITDESFNEWKEANPLPFPLGRVAEKSDQPTWASEVDSLPWLILADASHRVVAEGFALEELDVKLKALAK